MEAVVASLRRLRCLLARYPLMSFLVLTLMLAAIYPVVWLWWLTGAWPGLVVVLICWASGDQPPLPSRRVQRLCITGGVVAAVALLSWPVGLPTGAFYLTLFVTMCLVTGYLWSCVFSPHAAVRALARSLTVWRLPVRIWLVALLPWPLAAAATVALSHLLVHPFDGSYIGGGGSDFGRFALSSIVVGLTSTGAILAWYGFAAGRLLRRWSPLAVALVVGLLQWLFEIANLFEQHVVVSFWLLTIMLSLVATAIFCVWLYMRSRGLIPVLVVQTVAYVAVYAVAMNAVSGPDSADEMTHVYLGLQCAAALALVIAGRMWRRPPEALVSNVASEDVALAPGAAAT